MKNIFKPMFNLFDLINMVIVFPMILRVMGYSIASLFVALGVLIIALLISVRMERRLAHGYIQ